MKSKILSRILEGVLSFSLVPMDMDLVLFVEIILCLSFI